VRTLLDSYSSLFEPPVSLPPSRFCDHSIPLIEGARPVHVRPYRFSPLMKDEVEYQISEMLCTGLIQQSTGSFSSLVLLVKKDNTWWFCVDYRHLNALTVKSKYPVPIIDELLDELSCAAWFSILDLCAGFHRILLQAGEEYKTPSKPMLVIMSSVLCPLVSLEPQNHTLAPLLRKYGWIGSRKSDIVRILINGLGTTAIPVEKDGLNAGVYLSPENRAFTRCLFLNHVS
jgi:hypothetical protein